MKGILLAGGSGSRLQPLTDAISKQLLPIYDKPLIYYPLSVLMLAGIREILVISTPRDIPNMQRLLGDGSQLGLILSYKVQDQPNGIAEAFLLGKDFIAGEPVCLILGDNIFYGNQLGQIVTRAAQLKEGAEVFAYSVKNPQSYGVINFDDHGRPQSIEEKPKQPKSNWAVAGVYFYDSQVVSFAEQLRPSARGELEITDINKKYLEKEQLEVTCLKRGFAWLDAGTFDGLLSSSQFVQTIEQRQGLKISCLEEIALNKGFIAEEQFLALIERYQRSEYGAYLHMVLDEWKLSKTSYSSQPINSLPDPEI